MAAAEGAVVLYNGWINKGVAKLIFSSTFDDAPPLSSLESSH
jgi:hypothetical protein